MLIICLAEKDGLSRLLLKKFYLKVPLAAVPLKPPVVGLLVKSLLSLIRSLIEAVTGFFFLSKQGEVRGSNPAVDLLFLPLSLSLSAMMYSLSKLSFMVSYRVAIESFN